MESSSNIFTKTLSDFIESNPNCILIGGLSLSFLGIPRGTENLDFLAKEEDIEDIKWNSRVKFKANRAHAITNKETGIEVELVTSKTVPISDKLVQDVYNNSLEKNGVKFASPAGIIALKLHRLSDYDRGDIKRLIKKYNVEDLQKFDISPDKIQAFLQLKKELEI